MDVKALAKSKRAHTQHHSKKPHHGHKLKAPSSSSPSSGSNDTVGAAKKPLGKQQVNEKTTTHNRSSRSQGSSGLPNNWDRYEDEEFDSVSEGVSLESASKTPDVVLPKSKGADFRHLVAEAQSQGELSLEGFPSLDDILPGEFSVGLGSMLAVRGEGILSLVGDDNFVVEDKTSVYQEASCISLNLHALAENLAKVDLAKRLFIESDLLPTELCVQDLSVSKTEEPSKLETAEDSELANKMSKELNLDDFTADTSSNSCSSNHAASTFTLSNDFNIPVNYVDVEVKHQESNLLSAEDTRKKHSTFEVDAAEMELDMLLDSLGETKILDSSAFKSNTSLPVPSKIASITASLDDALDDLLEETSNLTNSNALLRSQEEKPVLHNIQSSHSASKAKVSDDFDSWFDTL